MPLVYSSRPEKSILLQDLFFLNKSRQLFRIIDITKRCVVFIPHSVLHVIKVDEAASVQSRAFIQLRGNIEIILVAEEK